jgi:hypothetical protein
MTSSATMSGSTNDRGSGNGKGDNSGIKTHPQTLMEQGKLKILEKMLAGNHAGG